jgi:hypothetical protein
VFAKRWSLIRPKGSPKRLVRVDSTYPLIDFFLGTTLLSMTPFGIQKSLSRVDVDVDGGDRDWHEFTMKYLLTA